MLDPRLIRNEPEVVAEGLAAKQVEVDMAALTALEERRRELIAEAEEEKRQLNVASESIALLKKEGKDASGAISDTRRISERVKELDTELGSVQAEFDEALLALPNLPDPQAPVGATPDENVVRETWGEKPEYDFDLLDHVDLCRNLGLVDFEAGTRLAGTGFILYTGAGARLVRGLINFMLDHQTMVNGYREVWPPTLVRTASMVGTGQLPKLADDMYRIEDEDLYLIPTAEVPVTNIHRESILPEEDLPISYAAFSACFRKEAGAHGADTRGLIRVHQFDNDLLGLHYRVLELCTGDLSFAARRCYDLELWSPAAGRWLEVSSCSNFGDFQARRADIRYRRAADRKVAHVHTLNASGVAVPRLLIAILETFQTDEGSVVIPEPLRPWMGDLSLIGPAGDVR